MKLVIAILSITTILTLHGCSTDKLPPDLLLLPLLIGTPATQPLSCDISNVNYSKKQCFKDRKTVDALTHMEYSDGGS